MAIERLLDVCFYLFFSFFFSLPLLHSSPGMMNLFVSAKAAMKSSWFLVHLKSFCRCKRKENSMCYSTKSTTKNKDEKTSNPYFFMVERTNTDNNLGKDSNIHHTFTTHHVKMLKYEMIRKIYDRQIETDKTPIPCESVRSESRIRTKASDHQHPLYCLKALLTKWLLLIWTNKKNNVEKILLISCLYLTQKMRKC